MTYFGQPRILRSEMLHCIFTYIEKISGHHVYNDTYTIAYVYMYIHVHGHAHTHACLALPCIALHHITLIYSLHTTLHCIAVHYITLQ